MPLPSIGRKKLAYNRLARERRQCDRSDKLLAIRRYHHLNLGSGLYQKPQQSHALVSRDTSADAEYYMLA